MNKKEKEIIIKKLNFFKQQSKSIHVVLNSRKFFNGHVGHLGSEFFLIVEFDGSENPVFFCEVESIEEYKQKK